LIEKAAANFITTRCRLFLKQNKMKKTTILEYKKLPQGDKTPDWVPVVATIAAMVIVVIFYIYKLITL